MSSRAKLLFLVLLVVSVGAFVRLGLWQLERLGQRRALNRVALEARRAPPVDLNEARRVGDSVAGRRARARGRYDRQHEIIVRSQTYGGTPGVHVVTPLRLSGRDEAVMVNRGFVPAPDAVSAEVAGLDEPGEVEVEGLLQVIGAGRGVPITRSGRTTWGRLDLGAIRDSIPYPVLDVALVQSPDTALPSFPRRLDAPALDDGPHLSYAIQWFAFALIAAVFGAVFLGKNARRER